MPKVKITKTFISRVAIPPSGKVRYTDTIESSFIVEIRSSGTKTFYYRYNKDGKTHYEKIGIYPYISVEDARAAIEKLKSEIIYQNPSKYDLTSCSSSNSVTTPSITLQEFYINYYLPYIKTSKKSYKQDINFYKNHILPTWGKIPMNHITRANITQKHISLVQTNNLSHSTANKLIKYLSHTFNLAISWSIPHIQLNPTNYIKLFNENNIVERYLTKKEIATVVKIAASNNNPLILPIIQFLLLTGARKSEVLTAKWEDIDLLNNIFTIPLTKAGKVRRIPISPKLKEVIETIPRYSDIYIFPSTKTGKPIVNFQFHWYKIRTKANLPEVRIHDLRHTYASTLVNAGVSLYEVQKLLGHSNIAVTQRYSHLSNASLYDATCKAEGLLE